MYIRATFHDKLNFNSTIASRSHLGWSSHVGAGFREKNELPPFIFQSFHFTNVPDVRASTPFCAFPAFFRESLTTKNFKIVFLEVSCEYPTRKEKGEKSGSPHIPDVQRVNISLRTTGYWRTTAVQCSRSHLRRPSSYPLPSPRVKSVIVLRSVGVTGTKKLVSFAADAEVDTVHGALVAMKYDVLSEGVQDLRIGSPHSCKLCKENSHSIDHADWLT